MKQRIRDFLHERAIKRQNRVFIDAQKSGTPGDKTREWEKLRTLLLHRSPEQVRRMELAQFRKLDPHAQQTFMDSLERDGIMPRTTIKRGVMAAFLRGLVPAWMVRIAFRVFKLRGA